MPPLPDGNDIVATEAAPITLGARIDAAIVLIEKEPLIAVGIGIVAGLVLARLFSGGRDV